MGSGRLEGKVAIVTGGAGGIGSETVRHFVDEGASVVIADLDESGEALAKEFDKAAVFARLDVRDPASWASVVEVCNERFGAPSVLINNAGVMAVTPVEDATVEQFEQPFRVNTLGSFLGIQAVVPSMREIGGGAIVNISSTAGLVGIGGLSAYAASKAGNAVVAKCAAIELGGYGIRVNSVHPGGIDTPMNESDDDVHNVDFDRDAWAAALPISRIGVTSEVAPLLVYLASDESKYCTGAAFIVDGGQLARPNPLL